MVIMSTIVNIPSISIWAYGGSIIRQYLDNEKLKSQLVEITEKYNSQSDAFTTSGRGLDYGLINPVETRKILGFLLETFWESKHRAMKPNSFGIARM